MNFFCPLSFGRSGEEHTERPWEISGTGPVWISIAAHFQCLIGNGAWIRKEGKMPFRFLDPFSLIFRPRRSEYLWLRWMHSVMIKNEGTRLRDLASSLAQTLACLFTISELTPLMLNLCTHYFLFQCFVKTIRVHQLGATVTGSKARRFSNKTGNVSKFSVWKYTRLANGMVCYCKIV